MAGEDAWAAVLEFDCALECGGGVVYVDAGGGGAGVAHELLQLGELAAEHPGPALGSVAQPANYEAQRGHRPGRGGAITPVGRASSNGSGVV